MGGSGGDNFDGDPPPVPETVERKEEKERSLKGGHTYFYRSLYTQNVGIPETDRIVWALGLLEANGGGVRKRYFLDKVLALMNVSHGQSYSFLGQLRGFEWVQEKEQKDGEIWVLLTDSGLEELQARRTQDLVTK